MRRFPVYATLLSLAAGLGSATSSLALPNRVFVSARSGNDANSCDNILTPCQTFQGGINQVAPGGEVIALDSGGYGRFNISKAVKIEAPPGIVAFVHPSSGTAVSILAGSTDSVILRGLVLSVGAGDGINAGTVGELHVENCVIDGFVRGIEFQASGKLFVLDTIIRNSSAQGIEIHPSSGTAVAAIERCRLEKNQDGLEVSALTGGVAKASIKESFASGQSDTGLRADADSVGTAELNIENCLVANNVNGIFGFANVGMALVRVSNTTVTDNTGTGVHFVGNGQVVTRGNNTVEGNATNGTFAGTFTAK